MAMKWVRRLREWVSTLNRYAALLLLLVPWLILESIKPIGFLLFAHKHHLAATSLIVRGEVVKLTLFEQLFDVTKPKLMSFHWFAWRAAIDYLQSLPLKRDWYGRVRAWVRRRWHFSVMCGSGHASDPCEMRRTTGPVPRMAGSDRPIPVTSCSLNRYRNRSAHRLSRRSSPHQRVIRTEM
jgi:hypothetical protein